MYGLVHFCSDIPPVHALQREGKQLGQEGVGSWSDTSEGAIRAVMLAAR